MNDSIIVDIDALCTQFRDAIKTLAIEADQSAMTRAELQESLGISRPKAIEMLRTLKRAGMLEVVQVHRMRIDDRLTVVSAYRLIPETEKDFAE